MNVCRGLRSGGGRDAEASSKGRQAYTEIGAVLGRHGFSRVQGSLYVTENEDMANLFLAIQALRDRDWFPKSVRDIRAFRIEQWSDFTALVKS